MPPVRTAALLALTLAACGPADGQVPDDDADRRERIVAGLRLEVPALREATVEVTELEDGDIAGLDRGTFSVDGQAYPFLVTEDGTHLLLLAAEPVDISRSAEDVAAALAAESEEAARAAAERGAVLAEATQALPARGPADAPVTVVEFSDFQCPYCARAAGTVEALLERYPDDVRLVYAHFPLGNHAWARPAAIASTCAAEQDTGAFWALHDLYFREQQALTPETVVDRSRAALAGSPVDVARWEACATDTGTEAHQAAARSVDAQMALGEEYGVRGTPAFFVNGQELSGAQPIEAFEAAVQAALDAR
jgi:protein-disulfide isomerase